MLSSLSLFTQENPTIDAFYEGRFYLCQAAKGTHRSGLDAMLLAASIPASFSGYVADFGAGAGAAGFAVATKCKDSYIALIEKCPLMLSYAQKSAEIEHNHALKNRIKLYQADLNQKGQELLSQGLKPHSFDFVLMNPPYNAEHRSRAPKAGKANARLMSDSLFENWIRNAALLLKAKGHIALIARPCGLKIILDALDKRFGNVEIFPIAPLKQQSAIRIIIRAQRDSRASLQIKPTLALREYPEAELAPQIKALCNGYADL